MAMAQVSEEEREILFTGVRTRSEMRTEQREDILYAEQLLHIVQCTNEET